MPFSIDYWLYFKYLVRDLSIAPSEVWSLDLVEIHHLSDNDKQAPDLSVMLNFERAQNGASKKWLTQQR